MGEEFKFDKGPRQGSIYQYIQYSYYEKNDDDIKPLGIDTFMNRVHNMLYTLMSADKARVQAELYTKFLNECQKEGNIKDTVERVLSPQQIKDINNEFIAMVKEKFPQFEFDLEKLDLIPNDTKTGISFIKPIEKEIPQTKKEKDNNEEKRYLDMYDLNAVIAQAGNLIDFINGKEGSATNETFQKYITELNECKKEVSRIQSRYHEGDLVSSHIRSGEMKNKAREGHEVSTLVGRINAVAKDLMSPSKKTLGDLAEWYYAFLLQHVGREYNAGLAEAFEPLAKLTSKESNVVTGKDLVKTTYNFNNMLTETERKIIAQNLYPAKQGEIHYDENGNYVTSSQGTEDICVVLPELQDVGGKISVNKNGSTFRMSASVKNYGSMKDIHIVSGAPVTSLLGVFDSNFIQHYYNLIAQHEGQTSPQDISEKINRVLLYSGLHRGLAGARLGIKGQLNSSGMADFFIVNDRSKKHVTVYSTLDMILTILKSSLKTDGKKITSFVNFERHTPPPKKFSIPNIWEEIKSTEGIKESAEARSALTFTRIHQQKVSIILKGNAIQKQIDSAKGSG